MSDPKPFKPPYEMPEGYDDTGIPVEAGSEDWRPKFTEEEMAEWGRKTMEWWREKQERQAKKERTQ